MKKLNITNYSRLSSTSAFTLMELLVVIGLLSALAIGLIAVLNPMSQIAKANDAKRKSELSTLKKTFEDYYNDKSCYPKPSEVCIDGGNSNCTICGSASGSPSTFNPYLSKLPCDPQYPSRKYLYSVDSDEIDCPASYRIYVNLSNDNDKDIADVGCEGNVCGPYADSNYGISSPNVDLERNGTVTPTPTPGSGGPTNTPFPTPTGGIPVCVSGDIAKVSGGICNTHNCGGQGEQQGQCICTDAEPCYNDFPTCQQRCSAP